MFLQISTLLFAVQWLGSPWMLSSSSHPGIWKAIVSCLFFTAVIIISVIPAMNREWKTYIKSLIVCALLQLVFMFFTFILPGIGLAITIIYNIVLFIISKKLPVSFTNKIKTGIVFFILWFAGINHLLGIFILTDPRGVWSGDLYFQITDWVILLVFIAALAITVYQIKTNLPVKKKIMIPVVLVSVIALTASVFIKLPWQHQAADDLKAAFAAMERNDYDSAQAAAQKYYNEKKILHNGDVFYLNGLLNEEKSPQQAMQLFKDAASWYKNHDSLVSKNYLADSQHRISMIYMNETPPDYYRAKNAAENALKQDRDNRTYIDFLTEIKEKLALYEKENNIGFIRRFWNNLYANF